MEKEYLKSSEEILQELQTSHQGLTDQQAETRLAQYGENRLQEGRKTTMLERFVEELKDPMLIMLMAAAAVSAITNIISHEPLTEVFIIIAVVLLNAVLGVFQESKAEEAIEALQKMTAAECKVLRNGSMKIIENTKLVPGDIVMLEAGDAVPADGRLLEARSLKIEEAALTGESVPVNKMIDLLYLQEGEILSLQELLYGLMLSSGNDAAAALALYCSGSIEEFAGQMNDKARMLGMKNTHFQNPHGLDAKDHYSTASDLAILASYAMDNPIFQKTVSTKSVTVGSRFLRNHNKLLWLFPEADGVKTGYTKAAGRILVSSAVRNGRRLVAVTIDDPNDWKDHQTLANQGFSEYNLQRIVTRGDCVGYREIASGEKKKVAVLADENFVYAISQQESPQLLLSGSGFLYAPVAEGADAGYAYVLLSGKAVGKIPVVYGETIEMAPEKEKRSFFRRM